ncbi:uncharacterized protein LOC125673491 isoform X2 [Ostrea edulis]|nr:uncharacterized protein LOC125673491 isoform X2 [Ostrea edulis]
MENIYASACNDDEITLECPAENKIAIKRVYYGAKLDANCAKRGPLWSSGCCERGKADCLVPNSDIYTTMNIRCSGYKFCQTTVERIRTKSHCDRKFKYTTYMTVVYSCIADSDTAQFCNNEIKQGKELYLSNQDYPKPIKGGGQYCKCLVRSNGGISINIIDIMITMPEKTDTCPQQLHISDSSSLPNVVVQCGQSGMYGFRNLYHRMVTNLTATLDSRAQDSRGYIWINIKAQQPEDYVVIYCGEAMDQLLYRNVTKVVSSDNPQVTVSSLGTVSPSGNGSLATGLSESQIIPDMIAIIGGVAGAMAVILIVCVVAIAVHCTRERERSNFPKMPEVIPSPMVRGKVYHPEDKNATHKKYHYEEDRYCSIKRSPMKLTNFSDVEDEADKKLKEAFLQGPAEEIEPEPPVIPVNHVKVNGVMPRPRSPELPLILDPPADYCSVPESNADKYFTMNPQKPLSEMAEIRVTSSLPQRGHKNKKPKTVTFSPVAMVTPLPSGSEESIGSEGDRNLANIIDSYQCLHDEDDFPSKKPLILPPPNETGEFASIHGPNEAEIAEMQELWNTLGSPSVTTTMDDGAYDNIDYLLAQNKAQHEYEV